MTIVQETRTYIPAIYDCTFTVPKGEPSPTLLRIFKGIPSSVRQLKTSPDDKKNNAVLDVVIVTSFTI